MNAPIGREAGAVVPRGAGPAPTAAGPRSSSTATVNLVLAGEEEER